MRRVLLLPIIAGLLLSFNAVTTYAEPINDKLREIPVRVVDDRLGVNILISSSLLFHIVDEPIINPRSYGILSKVASVINEYPDVDLTVTAHTDQVLTPTQQLEISEAQARAVADFLVTHGVSAKRIYAVRGEGSSHPVYLGNDPVSRAHNRRVEITLHARIK